MKILYIIRGVSGSGKSELAETLTPLYFATDDYFEDNNIEWSRDLLHRAHKDCQDSVEECMAGSYGKIAVSNTFTKTKELKPYHKLAEKYGYTVFHLVVENRHSGTNVHDVPEDTLVIQETNLRESLKLR